ncbi:MAG: hypothetical protein HW421_371 [Ignavibacteria bacterium]|nr:hypothetical protein [Ignavibacteria bacterium]
MKSQEEENGIIPFIGFELSTEQEYDEWLKPSNTEIPIKEVIFGTMEDFNVASYFILD